MSLSQFEGFIGVDFWTALFVLLNTIAIFLVARKFLFNPVHKMITDRQQEIDSLYADAEKAKSEAAGLEADYRLKLQEAQATSDRLVKEATARASQKEEEILARAGREATAILEKAERDVAQEKKKAVTEARNEISSMAVAIAEKVVGREVNQEDQNELVERFIRELGE